jgi:hypothetical protein
MRILIVPPNRVSAMLGGILRRLGLGRPRDSQAVLQLEVIARQVKEFNEAKEQIDTKISSLETKACELDGTVSKTLEITRENQMRLENIESNLNKIAALSEAYITGKAPQAEPKREAEEEKD